jgi:endonuclease/exonuclease/phosphatase (EEP) superfamily protein YafD
VATSSNSERVKRGSVTLDGLLRVAAVLTVLFSVLTAIDTRQHYVELFSHFRLQYLVVSLLLLIVFAVRRRAIYSLLLIVAFTINASFVLPWYDLPLYDPPLYDNSQAATGDTRLKFLYANVLSTNRDHERLLDLISSERPDVILLQEVSTHWLAALQTLEADYPFSYSAAREDNFGIAIWSRLPLAAATHVDSPPLGYPTIIATTRIGGTDLTIISTHPMIPLGRDNFGARNVQLQSVTELVAQASGEVLLSGDLNASVWDRHYRHFEKITGLRNARRGKGILPTWPTFMRPAMIPIDHVLVSSRIGITDIKTGPRIGSDHLPLIVTVTL